MAFRFRSRAGAGSRQAKRGSIFSAASGSYREFRVGPSERSFQRVSGD
jgi:hypothetical protein